jgi:hypothetical protein
MRYSANSFSRACFFSSSFLFIIPFLSFFMVFVLCGSARAVSDINYEYLKCIETAETVSKEAGAAAFHKTALKCIKSNSDPEIGASCLVRAAEIYMSINGDSQKIKDILQLVVGPGLKIPGLLMVPGFQLVQQLLIIPGGKELMQQVHPA